jgi:hypothetical protein
MKNTQAERVVHNDPVLLDAEPLGFEFYSFFAATTSWERACRFFSWDAKTVAKVGHWNIPAPTAV